MFMKILYGLALICIVSTSYAQDIKEIFISSNTSLEFVGLDFSKAKMVGLEGIKPPDEIQGHYFDAWNGLLLKEITKYDVRRAFNKKQLPYVLNIAQTVNQNANIANLLTNYSPKAFTKKDIQTIVEGYNTTSMKAKYGLSFVVHSFNRFQEKGHFYVVIFDVASKQVLFYERVSGEAGGFGFRNYWARTVYNALEDIRDYKYRGWKKQLTHP